MPFPAWLVSEELGKPVNRQLVTRWHSEESLARADAAANHVVGLALVEADFVYESSVILSSQQNAQRLHWKALGIEDGMLWFYNVLDVILFHEPLPSRQYLRHGAVRVYDLVSDDIAADLAVQLESRPDWYPQHANPTLVISVPERLAPFFSSHTWCRLGLPSPFAQAPWRVPAWKLQVMGDIFLQDFQGRPVHDAARDDGNEGHQLFCLTHCQELADDLRALLVSVPDETKPMLAIWVKQLQNSHDNMVLPVVKSAKFHRLIDFVFLCDMLRNVQMVKPAILKALELTLPESLLNVAKQQLAEQRVYDKSQISRFRVVLDCALMLWHRCSSWQHSKQLHASGRKFRYLMWDASPQFAREYEMIRVVSLPENDGPDLYHRYLEMCTLWLNDAGELEFDRLEDGARLAEEIRFMDKISATLEPHVLPAVLLSQGGTTLAHKLHAMMHAFRLEVFTHEALATYCQEITSVTADFGVEHMLFRVPHVPVASVCEWFSDADEESIQQLTSEMSSAHGFGGAVFEDPANSNINNFVDLSSNPMPVADELDLAPDHQDMLHDLDLDMAAQDVLNLGAAYAAEPPDPGLDALIFEEPPPAPVIDFSAMLSIPGVHHVLDNAVNGLQGAMQSFNNHLKLAVSVCKFLRRPGTRDMLLTRCFNNAVGQRFIPHIKKFKGAIFLGRWGTIAFSIPHILSLERGLRWAWNKDMFLRDEAGNMQSTTTLVDDVDAAFCSPDWWAWLKALELLVSMLRQCTAWLESCPCHGKICALEGLPVSLLQRWRKCPMRGLRSPELCNGEFLEVVGRLSDRSAVQVLQVLPGDISPEMRASILQEFSAGRSHLCFYLALKLSAMEQFPWRLCALAHKDTQVAHRALREALACNSNHPKLQAVQGPLRPLAERWLAGESLQAVGMFPLASLVSELCFIPLSERPVEGLHRQTKLTGRSRPSHSVPLMSLMQRMPEIQAKIAAQPRFVHDLAGLCHQLRNNQLCVSSLCLQAHPSIASVQGSRNKFRHPLLARIIYHADPFTLYAAAPPVLPNAPDDDDDDAGDDAGNGEGGNGNGHEQGGALGDDEDAGPRSDVESMSGQDGPGQAGDAAAVMQNMEPPPPGSLESLVQNHTGASAALLQKYMVERIFSVFSEHGTAGAGVGMFLSLPFTRSGMRTLSATLGVRNAGEAGCFHVDQDVGLAPLPALEGPEFEEDGPAVADMATLARWEGFTEKARSLLFFQVVRANPMALKRSKSDKDKGIVFGDIVIAPHKLCSINPRKRHAHVEAVSLQIPGPVARDTVMLSLKSLEPSVLIHLRLWQKKETLHYSIKREMLPDENGLSEDCFEAMSILLEDMLSSEKGVRERFWRLSAERKQVLDFFHMQEWACKNDVTGLNHNCTL